MTQFYWSHPVVVASPPVFACFHHDLKKLKKIKAASNSGAVPLISPCRRSIPTCGIVESAQRQFGPLPAENSERLRRIDSTCRLAQGGHVDRYTSHPRTRTAYCVVPKTSCTFWLSLFRFLRRPASAMRGDNNPLSIPRAQVHSEQDGQVRSTANNVRHLHPAQVSVCLLPVLSYVT